MRRVLPWLAGLLLAAAAAQEEASFPEPAIQWSPRHLVCRPARGPLVVDGRLDEPAWKDAPWSDDFVDIRGGSHPAPPLRTRVRMLFDAENLYVAAELEEPHVWATLTRHDSVIFHDNDFEVFLDPDGDGHLYYELEVNALGTTWDLLLVRPYRDGGPAVHAWEIPGLQVGVEIDGTGNDPRDQDRGWRVETALPWAALAECAGGPVPPRSGDRWRVNFSRVEWRTRVEEGAYRKVTDPDTGKPLPEENWVWSPQGLVNMHYPEMWGFVTFAPAGEEAPPPAPTAQDAARFALYRVYYRQRTFRARTGRFCADPEALGLEALSAPGYQWPPALSVTPSGFEAVLSPEEGGARLHLTGDGRSWVEKPSR